MIRTDRIYRRTEAGIKALESAKSVPGWFRAMLSLISGETHSNVICGGMCSYSQRQVLDWLDELETLGFVELLVVASSSPDETRDFSMPSMLAHEQAA